MKKLYEEEPEFFEELGFENSGEDRWNLKGRNEWILEYMGTEEYPNQWRIDNFDSEGFQIVFLDIENRKQLINLLNMVDFNKQVNEK